MTRLSDKFDPIDVIAMMIIFGCITSMAIRGDTIFKDLLQTIVGFYFGRNTMKDSRPPSDKQKLGILVLLMLNFYV